MPPPPIDVQETKKALETEILRSQRLLRKIEARMSPPELRRAQQAFQEKVDRARESKFS